VPPIPIGTSSIVLQPANVTLQRNQLIGGTCRLAKVGRGVLTQARSVSSDFAAMSLQLQ
jgi:hypothetical protein